LRSGQGISLSGDSGDDIFIIIIIIYLPAKA